MKFDESKLLILVVCAILGFMMASQISFGKPGTGGIYSYQSYQQVVSELNKLEGEINMLSEQKKELESKLYTISNQTTSETIKQFENDLNTYDFNEGLVKVKGPGVIVTVADSSIADPEAYFIYDPALLLVHNSDLRDLVWELKNQGAEAISINGQRIVSRSEISCVGTMIKVNGVKISSPYEIKAIGDPAKLTYALEKDDSIYKQFEDRTLEVSHISDKSIVIPEYTGSISFQSAKPVN